MFGGISKGSRDDVNRRERNAVADALQQMSSADAQPGMRLRDWTCRRR